MHNGRVYAKKVKGTQQVMHHAAKLAGGGLSSRVIDEMRASEVAGDRRDAAARDNDHFLSAFPQSPSLATENAPFFRLRSKTSPAAGLSCALYPVQGRVLDSVRRLTWQKG